MPLDDETLIQCQLPPKTLQSFLRDIHLRGKAAIHLQVTTSNGKDITSEFNCRYVAIN